MSDQLKCPKCNSFDVVEERGQQAGDLPHTNAHYKCSSCGFVSWLPATNQVPRQLGGCGTQNHYWESKP